MGTNTIIGLDAAAIGRPIIREDIALFPLYLPGRTGPDIAPNSDEILISERGSAQVPSIQVTNPSARPVLLVEGETISGGQQDRVLNVSVLVAAGGSVDVPVSCIEAGRWDGESTFQRGRTFATRRVRRTKTDSIGRSVSAGRSKQSDQGEVWNTIGAELRRLEVHSDTDSLHAADVALDFRGMRTNREWMGDTTNLDLAKAADDIIARGPLAGQCGVVIAHGRRIVSAEVFATPELLAANWEPLVRAIFLDAPIRPEGRASASMALRFVHRMATAQRVEAAGVGLGRESHLRTHRLVGQALTLGDDLVHASAFALGA